LSGCNDVSSVSASVDVVDLSVCVVGCVSLLEVMVSNVLLGVPDVAAVGCDVEAVAVALGHEQ
jgi:hypothetical protein